MQFGWDLMDVSIAGRCLPRQARGDREHHRQRVDRLLRRQRHACSRRAGIDILHDSFLEEVDQAYNSFFDAYIPDTVAKYSGAGPPPLPKAQQMYLDVTDKDHLASVEIVGSIDEGETWVSRPMTLDIPQRSDRSGPRRRATTARSRPATSTPARPPGTVGTECWYYVKTTDDLDNRGVLPGAGRTPLIRRTLDGVGRITSASRSCRCSRDTYTGVKILLVDGMNQNIYDYGQCVGDTQRPSRRPRTSTRQTLRMPATATTSSTSAAPARTSTSIRLQFTDYDAVVWFTGPYFSNYLFDKEAQIAIRAYLADGGKVVLCGDRIAYDMAVVGEDSLGGEFLAGVLGTTYQEEMEGAFDKPLRLHGGAGVR